MPIADFDELFMNEAYLYANKSKDPSTQVGAVIVRDKVSIMRGYNGPMRGADDSDPNLFVEPYKKYAMVHAERNAFYNCARHGVSTLECSMYLTFAPCHECAQAIVQCGINRVVIHADAPVHHSQSWQESIAIGMDFMHTAGIEIEYWSGNIIIPTLRFAGGKYEWEYDKETGKKHWQLYF